MQVSAISNLVAVRQFSKRQINQLYVVEHNGDAEYMAETLTACYKWIALKLNIPADVITHIQAIDAGYRVRVL